MSSTWLVFEDGSYYSLSCSLHKAPKGHPKPVDGYLVTEHEGDFTIAARKAVHAVYSCALEKGVTLEPVVAGFDLSERTRLDTRIAGQSGGLSFAVAFAQKLLQYDPGHIAATGVIEAEGRIGPVKGINEKINTAAELIGENGWILFPEKNFRDLLPELKTRIEKKNIKLLPVSSVGGVLEKVFSLSPAATKKKKRSFFIIMILVAVSCAAIAGAWFYSSKKDQPTLFPMPDLTRNENPEPKSAAEKKDIKPADILKTEPVDTVEIKPSPAVKKVEDLVEKATLPPKKMKRVNAEPEIKDKKIQDNSNLDDKGFD